MKEYMDIVAIPRISETKKITLLSEFAKGQRFTGRVVELSEDGTSVAIRLKDGSKFTAKLDEPLKNILDGVISFEVDGLDNGILKLKIIKENQQVLNQGESIKDSIESIINRLGISSDKKELLEKMLEFKIPLTKENIENMLALLNFRDNTDSKGNMIDNFIASYVSSKGIGASSKEGEFVMENLNKFCNEIKTLSNSEIMSFIEGKIEVSAENIKSFNRIFKEQNGLFNELIQFEDNIESEILSKRSSEFSKVVENLKAFGLETQKFSIEDYNKLEHIFKEKEFNCDINDMESLKLDFPSKINKTKLDSLKLDNINEILDKLKILDFGISKNEFVKSSLERVSVDIKAILEENKLKFSDEKLKDIFNSIVKNFNSLEEKHIPFIKRTISKIQKEVLGIKDFINNSSIKELEKYDGNMKVSKEFDNVLKNFTEVKVELSEKQEVMKEIIKGIVEKVSVNDGATNIISTMLKDKISDFKIFNDFSNEYYYLDVPLKLNDEYPCKLIIKDQRKDGKELDSKNIKLVINIKTLKLGDVDALIDVNQSDIKVNIKVLKENMKILEKNSDKLHKALELLGFMPYILVSEKKEIEDKSLSEYREFFNDTSILAIDRKV
ncbi:MAG: hypothetical protein ACRCYE_04450 [Sarcina sp.]